MKICESNEYRQLNELVPWHDNPREWPDDSIKSVTESLEQFGLFHPLLIRKLDNSIIGGNLRYHVIKSKVDSGEWSIDKIPVTVLDVSENVARAIVLRDNKSDGSWDYSKLPLFLKSIVPELIPYVGFSEVELSGMLNLEKTAEDLRTILGNKTAHAAEHLNQLTNSGEGFRTIQLRLPNGIADQLDSQIDRLKSILYPLEHELEKVSYVVPIQILCQIMAEMPEENLRQRLQNPAPIEAIDY